MNEELEAQLRHAAVGHGLITKIGHADDVKAGYIRMVALIEKKKRGVRFLPEQVIKRALRKQQAAGREVIRGIKQAAPGIFES